MEEEYQQQEQERRNRNVANKRSATIKNNLHECPEKRKGKVQTRQGSLRQKEVDRRRRREQRANNMFIQTLEEKQLEDDELSSNNEDTEENNENVKSRFTGNQSDEFLSLDDDDNMWDL